LSGPFADTAPEQVGVALVAWRWPLRMSLSRGIENRFTLTCGRGTCRAELLVLSDREAQNWPVELAQLAQLAGDHLIDCQSVTVPR
jgi:hypothetical protein